MKVDFSKNAKKDLKNLEKFVSIHIIKKIKEYVLTGRGDVKKLKDDENSRLRIGNYRVLFFKDKNKIEILRIKHRSQIYE